LLFYLITANALTSSRDIPAAPLMTFSLPFCSRNWLITGRED